MSIGVATPDAGDEEPERGLAPAEAAARPLLASLLQRLAAEQPAAGVAYEQLRRRLIVYFRLHLPAEAESLADLTFDRIARKLQEGTQIRNLPHYAAGVARMICLEAREREQRRRRVLDDPTLLPAGDDEDEALQRNAVAAVLSACLEQIGARSRALILSYYAGDGTAQQRERRRLAAEQGISLNSLRNRALRIRQAVEQCVRQRLKAP